MLSLPYRATVRDSQVDIPGVRDPGLAAIQVVDMREELKDGNRSIFSRQLQQALSETLAAGNQSILFLNRRGTATHIFCRRCGYVLDLQTLQFTAHRSWIRSLFEMSYLRQIDQHAQQVSEMPI